MKIFLQDGTLLTELLQEVHIRLFDQDQCVKRYGDIGESKFCTIEKCGTHLCQVSLKINDYYFTTVFIKYFIYYFNFRLILAVLLLYTMF